MITNIQSSCKCVLLIIMGAVLLSLTGCNKEEESFMATEVRLTGYNNTGEDLEIQIDTIVYKNRRYYYGDTTSFFNNHNIPFSTAFLYYSADKPVLTLKGKTSGKIYFEQPIKKGVLRQRYGFTYVNGKNVYNPPAPDPKTNKVGFFLADNLIKDPIDIVISTKIYISNPDGSSSIETERMKLISNLKPFEWKYVDYIPKSMFASNDIYKINLSYYKAGTDIPAFPHVSSGDPQDTEIDVDKKEKSMFPVLDQRGKVISGIININGNTLGEHQKEFHFIDW